MRTSLLFVVFVILFCIPDACPLTYAQEVSLEPQAIMARVDSVLNAPGDQIYDMELILIELDGTERKRTLKMWQLGDDRRLAKFLEPADIRNVGFLALPDDVMYVYLPAFGKVRRIAGHVRNQSFAGTDFSYNDMGSISYSEDYTASMDEETPESYVLNLLPREGMETDYGLLRMWISKTAFYPTRTEYYDRGENLWKVMERRELDKVGDYWIAREIEMKDLKVNHSTIMYLRNIEFDSGLSRDMFTPRFLMRRP